MSAIGTRAGSLPAAMTFSRKSHSVTIPATSPVGRSTTAYPLRATVRARAHASASIVLSTETMVGSMMSRASNTIAIAHSGER